MVNTKDQRYNRFGMTGCLNFYDAQLSVRLVVNNGGCEDSLNIVKSSGTINSVQIFNSVSDAVDIDFSNILIFDLIVNEAGNDCFDVSSGTYRVHLANLKNCGDKGISVGEKSDFRAGDIILSSANIGISSKDYSTVQVSRANIENTPVCIEARQKKQEFGGAFIKAKALHCDGLIRTDDNSIFESPVE